GKICLVFQSADLLSHAMNRVHLLINKRSKKGGELAHAASDFVHMRLERRERRFSKELGDRQHIGGSIAELGLTLFFFFLIALFLLFESPVEHLIHIVGDVFYELI